MRSRNPVCTFPSVSLGSSVVAHRFGVASRRKIPLSRDTAGGRCCQRPRPRGPQPLKPARAAFHPRHTGGQGKQLPDPTSVSFRANVDFCLYDGNLVPRRLAFILDLTLRVLGASLGVEKVRRIAALLRAARHSGVVIAPYLATRLSSLLDQRRRRETSQFARIRDTIRLDEPIS